MNTEKLGSLFVGAFAALSSVYLACATPHRQTVVRNTPGAISEFSEGTPVAVRRWEMDLVQRPRAGWTLVRNADDWRLRFPDAKPGSIPNLPRGFLWDREMLAILAGGDPDAISVKVRGAVATDTTLHVYATQVLPGRGCVRPDGPPALDIVALTRSDLDTVFHMDVAKTEPCSPPTPPVIKCHVRGVAGLAPSPLKATLGQIIDCTTEPLKKREGGVIMERAWSFRQVAESSTTKLTFLNGNMGVNFTVDVFGSFVIRLEQEDDAGRRVGAEYTVMVDPPANESMVQLAWTKFAPTDDPSTFPKISLHAIEGTLKAYGDDRVDCFFDSALHPDWCSVFSYGTSFYARVPTDRKARFRIAVQYKDERKPEHPVACVRIYKGGKEVDRVCDSDTRSAGSYWDVGMLDSAESLFEDTITRRNPEPVDAGVDSGRSDAGTARAEVGPRPTGGVGPVHKPER
jgi:hypothetical protein